MTPEAVRRAKPTIVGETNPYGGNDCYALYPAPDGCSGHRLCCLILGMRQEDYLDSFERINLVRGKWSIRAARERAMELLLAGGKFILLGSKVCSAFGVSFAPFTVQDEVLLKIPHPSGLCRLWQEPGAFARARAAVAAFAPELAHLLGKEPS